MESGDIQNYQIKASSFHWPPGGVHSAPYLARANTVEVPGVSYSSWRVDGLTNTGSWVQVTMFFKIYFNYVFIYMQPNTLIIIRIV